MLKYFMTMIVRKRSSNKFLLAGLITFQQMFWGNCIMYGYIVETTSSIKTRNTKMNDFT